MLVIRLSRVGKKNHPQYKLVVAEKSAPIKGRFVEQLGSYNPHQKIATIKAERVQYWISKGATCSDTAWNILVSEKVVEGEKRKVSIPAKKVEEKQEAESEGSAKNAEAETDTPKSEEKSDEKSEEASKENETEEKVEEETSGEEKASKEEAEKTDKDDDGKTEENKGEKPKEKTEKEKTE